MSGEHNSGGRIAPLALAALGVVFGDIGTSPLYAMSACFTGPNIQVTPEHIFGILSPHLLGTRARDSPEVRRGGLERRQQGRGRGAGADRAGRQHRSRKSAKAHLRNARDPGCRTVLLGRCDHARHLGVERRRRSARRGTRCRDTHLADHHRRAGRPVPDPAARHRIRGQMVRTGDARLVRDPRGDGRDVDRARAPRAGRALAGVRAAADLATPDQRARGARRRVPHRHGRRGALCRHGTFRQNPHPLELGGDRHAGAGLELFRAGCAAHRESGRHLQSFLS